KTRIVHIREVSNPYLKDIHDVLSVADDVTVTVISVNDDGKIGLSIRKAQEQPVESGVESRPKKFQHKDSRDNRNRTAQKKSFSGSQPSAQNEYFY
ncbi:RNA-binding protein S1, partial [Enterococcus faecium]